MKNYTFIFWVILVLFTILLPCRIIGQSSFDQKPHKFNDPSNSLRQLSSPIPPMRQLCDTYNNRGPFSVFADISEVDRKVRDVIFYLKKNTILVERISMNPTVADSNIYKVEFTIDAHPGDMFVYYFELEDIDGNTMGSMPGEFKVLEPERPLADILFIFDGDVDKVYYEKLLEKVCSLEYELWDYQYHKGIDNSITEYGWPLVIIAATNTKAIPTRNYGKNPFAYFLQNSTDRNQRFLLLISNDYLFANGEPELVAFDRGDFVYDFFDLKSAYNDPKDGKFDSVFVGDYSKPISAEFFDNHLVLHPVTKNRTGKINNVQLWTDWLVPNNPQNSFLTSKDLHHSVGACYNTGTFKTVYLPWRMDTLQDSAYIPGNPSNTPSQQAIKLLQNILKYFEDQTNPVPHKLQKDLSFKLEQNYPNPFNSVTNIDFTLLISSHVKAEIFNVAGQKVKTLVDEEKQTGNFSLAWDGLDERGFQVSGGVYIICLNAGRQKEIKKALFLP